ncbi:hypothetical protein J3459_012006 [Metarhizium acridum]|nr:hypothetical protein J3459_012006 [Metarhizium acridum]
MSWMATFFDGTARDMAGQEPPPSARCYGTRSKAHIGPLAGWEHGLGTIIVVDFGDSALLSFFFFFLGDSPSAGCVQIHFSACFGLSFLNLFQSSFLFYLLVCDTSRR